MDSLATFFVAGSRQLALGGALPGTRIDSIILTTATPSKSLADYVSVSITLRRANCDRESAVSGSRAALEPAELV